MSEGLLLQRPTTSGQGDAPVVLRSSTSTPPLPDL